MTYDKKSNFFVMLYSLGTLTSGSFEEKLELIQDLCYFSFQLESKDSYKYKNVKSVLEELLDRKIVENVNGFDDYLINLSIICDDLLYQVTEVKKPDKYKDIDKVGNIIADRIKQLITQWVPF